MRPSLSKQSEKAMLRSLSSALIWATLMLAGSAPPPPLPLPLPLPLLASAGAEVPRLLSRVPSSGTAFAAGKGTPHSAQNLPVGVAAAPHCEQNLAAVGAVAARGAA